MENSQYNYFIPLNGKILVFNGYTKRFFFIQRQNAIKFKSVINHPEQYRSDPRYHSFLEKMKDAGFIVGSKEEQFNKIKKVFKEYQMADRYVLLILPTYSCNFSCWYCVQHHEELFMNEATIERIKNHIIRYTVENHIKSLYISWFGGEPLLCFDRIRQITGFAQEYCNKHGIEFSAGITTNGSLLNDNNIAEMRKLSFRSFQITIDGFSSYHNMTKKTPDIQNSFDVILNNIVKVVNCFPELDMTIRVNYTKDNITKDFVAELDYYLFEIKDKISIMFRKVWQVGENTLMHDNIISCIEQLIKKGYRVRNEYDNLHVLCCSVEMKNYLSIFPNGKVDKCANINIADARGHIEDDGSIRWSSQTIECKDNIFEKKSECKDCRFLPLCMGPCPLRREKCKKDDIIKCFQRNIPNQFYQTIVDYCKIKSNFTL
mgnify:CR=1 FL=1